MSEELQQELELTKKQLAESQAKLERIKATVKMLIEQIKTQA